MLQDLYSISIFKPTHPTITMLSKVPEGAGDEGVAITPNTPTEQQPSKPSSKEQSTPQHSQHAAYPPPHQPLHQDTDHPTQQPKRYEDILAYEDKWIGWDGPVWCARYGRFENQEDAAADDGYKSVGQVHHQGVLHITHQSPSHSAHFFSRALAEHTKCHRSRTPTLRKTRLRLPHSLPAPLLRQRHPATRRAHGRKPHPPRMSSWKANPPRHERRRIHAPPHAP